MTLTDAFIGTCSSEEERKTKRRKRQCRFSHCRKSDDSVSAFAVPRYNNPAVKGYDIVQTLTSLAFVCRTTYWLAVGIIGSCPCHQFTAVLISSAGADDPLLLLWFTLKRVLFCVSFIPVYHFVHHYISAPADIFFQLLHLHTNLLNHRLQTTLVFCASFNFLLQKRALICCRFYF